MSHGLEPVYSGWRLRHDCSSKMTGRSNKASAAPPVAIACWLDLLGYGAEMEAAGFDPADPAARKPLARLRAFHRIVAKHSDRGFPTLVMNDGAVAYGQIEPGRSDRAWRFIERCRALHGEAMATDMRHGGPGLRGVIAVGLRAKGSSRGIAAQEDAITRIIDDVAAGRITRDEAVTEAKRVRRVFDIVPQLQANFAFARAYLAEQSGSRAGLAGAKLFLDMAVFADGVPDWIGHEAPIDWRPGKKESLATTFIALREIGKVSAEVAQSALRNGEALSAHLSRRKED